MMKLVLLKEIGFSFLVFTILFNLDGNVVVICLILLCLLYARVVAHVTTGGTALTSVALAKELNEIKVLIDKSTQRIPDDAGSDFAALAGGLLARGVFHWINKLGIILVLALDLLN
jgi:hypothetical protein